jgi:preprotein translocase subunit SecB
MGLSTVATSNTAADSIDVIRQFVKDMGFIWPESPKDEEKIAKDITGIIESWDLGEQAEGCFKYVNYGIVAATVSLLYLL